MLKEESVARKRPLKKSKKFKSSCLVGRNRKKRKRYSKKRGKQGSSRPIKGERRRLDKEQGHPQLKAEASQAILRSNISSGNNTKFSP